MKIIENEYIYRKINNYDFIIPYGEAVIRLKGIIRLSSSGAFLWQLLSDNQTIESLANAMVEEYDVSLTQALASCERFISELREFGCLEE